MADKPSQKYLGNGKHEWERVNHITSRLRVVGGYLYLTTWSGGASQSFVPMPDVVKHKV